MLSALEKSIFQTLAFFASLEHPLTLLEIHNWLIRSEESQPPASFKEIEKTIEVLGDRIAGQNGLYTLPGNEQFFTNRHFTYINSLKLFKKAIQFGSGMRHLPFVRGAALAGSVTWTNSSEQSDIDIFIITEPGRIFLARLFVSAYFQIFGGRRHGNKIKDRFCLNHYVCSGKFFEKDRNIYTALIYANHTPIFGEEEFEKLWKKNIGWMKRFLLQPQFPSSHEFDYAKRRRSRVQKITETLSQPVAPALEKISAYFQRRRIQQGPYVSVAQDELSFHPDSKGQRALAKYQQVLEECWIQPSNVNPD